MTSAGPSAPLLALEGLSIHYGHVQALEHVSLEVRAGEVVTLIGANGAGQRTTLRAVAALGVAPLIVRGIFDIIRELHQAGVTILLVEQNASLALQIADRAYVLEAGRLTISGRAAELLTDERVRRAYLG